MLIRLPCCLTLVAELNLISFSCNFIVSLHVGRQLACCNWFRAVDPDSGHATVLIAHLTERLRADADLDGVRRIVRGARRALERPSTRVNSDAADGNDADSESDGALAAAAAAALDDRAAMWRAVLDRVEAEVQRWVGKHFDGARLHL